LALKTLGTAATNTLTAIKWNSAMAVADLAAFNALLKSPGTYGSTTFFPTPIISQGILYLPGRGQPLKLGEGDWIGLDPVNGTVILIDPSSAAGASWVHN
jgi:hypothetical protein